MKKHSDYITHINNKEDEVYLRTPHFPVNMRLFKTSKEYKNIILQQCEYIRKLCITKMEGYKKPHGMSSANAGLSFNIIGIVVNRNKHDETCLIMINPKIIDNFGASLRALSNCGSLTLDNPIPVVRMNIIKVKYYDTCGKERIENFDRRLGGFTIQHEIDHNNGILITDKR